MLVYVSSNLMCKIHHFTFSPYLLPLPFNPLNLHPTPPAGHSNFIYAKPSELLSTLSTSPVSGASLPFSTLGQRFSNFSRQAPLSEIRTDRVAAPKPTPYEYLY